MNRSAGDTHHLDCSLDVNLTVQAAGPDLVDDHVDDDEGPGPADTGGTVDYDGSGRV